MSLDCLRRSAQFSQEAQDVIKDIHTNVVKMSSHFLVFFSLYENSCGKDEDRVDFRLHSQNAETALFVEQLCFGNCICGPLD